MPPRARKTAEPLGFEETLWKAADTLRGSMDAASYKHVVLGLIFLKYISDAFAERRAALAVELEADGITGDDALPLLESRDEYTSQGVFWVPEASRWDAVRDAAKQPDVGRRIDVAMEALEADNASLRGVLPKEYAAATVDARRLGQLVDLVSGIGFGADEHGGKDVLGRVYEYFLGKFASAEGRKSGEFYTPRSIVRLLVEMLEPYTGRVYDPCCGSGGMFVQAERFVEQHGGQRTDLSVYGQESASTTWKLAKMNLAIRGIEADLGPRWADSFHEELHPELKADFILANPPFNVSDWGGASLRDDARWQYGTPPAGNANFAWLQHMVSHLSPRGAAGIVLSNGSLSTQQSGEGDIRRRLVEADLVECIVALPGQLFYGTGIPVSLWFLNRDKTPGGSRRWRDRRGEVLFLDGRGLGHMVSRTHKSFSDSDIARLADIFHEWRGKPNAREYGDVPGFARAVTLDEIAQHDWALTPGRYVGSEASDGIELLHDVVARLQEDLEAAFAASEAGQERVRQAMSRMLLTRT
ncbi:class I SAM-dependent DNA methyltransferase [uncultured Pseudokineococcus sp.]|uniref:class I SAM-dependent DNA methyltransferase n=1 Tax=uncultured Pseudokineococcus sp. TaxID=1642928 RepID=UPI0026201B2F|nr:class I SAM-dependent DNA methyltransferase [uncultured Pseudokineococcus sp.]